MLGIAMSTDAFAAAVGKGAAMRTPRLRDALRAAMAVGVGLAFLEVNILVVASVIGLTTFVMVTLGILLGRVLGAMAGKRAEIGGGVLLVLIGAFILFEHLTGAA
ncbi:manganese efflux pump [Luteimonas sp. A534]